ncbi:response regulator SirA [Shewanella sp. Choline-02u-19]|uniref:sulfurtransferase TusA family protein n=1 Tax=Shewanella TaxID=22 RepID=UPI000C324BCF|nr:MULTISPECIES: sulfurtransferase TusA family protein [Shewanella]MCL1058223.1 sulfurtransferase TusA family protein [Shewanella gelidimarina]PKG58351.1 response regulator SirA [Shewanella sp. GutDb-MelDb]PKG73831.1 response regulator SirA [Shewanella sp. GutCb]PKH56862.1 response regulator SirA [Shewanella sp. Bg11-22]PKI27659.1 response regulator SirA [Shewanella sp. Choline-02u-19]
MIIIDLTAFRCPLPLVKVKLALKQLNPGQKLRVLLSDPGSKQDVPRFLKKVGYHHQTFKHDECILALEITK